VSDPAVVRIAPSPTGDPHVGTAYMALFCVLLARKTGGRFILRVEDTDRTRYDPTSERKIFESLRWLGLTWDEGPDVGGPAAPYRQSERTALYREHAEILLARGAAYRCFCTEERLEEVRATQRAMKAPPGYDGFCRRLSAAEVAEKTAAKVPHVVRLAIPKEGTTVFHDDLRGDVSFENRSIDDQVLMKSDGFPTYHLANVVDDHAMGVTHVIRAEEWIPSTPKHMLLYAAFGWKTPRWMHMPLLRNADHTKISKRKNHTSLMWYRGQGYLPEAMLNFLALMGYAHGGSGNEVFALEDLQRDFEISKISTTGPVFDLEKLTWLNGEWIRRLAPDALAARIVEHFGMRLSTRAPEEPTNAVLSWLERTKGPTRDGAFAGLVAKTVPMVRERIKTLDEYAAIAACFYAEDVSGYAPEDLVAKKRTLPETLDALGLAREKLAGLPAWTAAEIEAALRGLAEHLTWKPGDLFSSIRVAVTGSRVSPPLFETLELLGRDLCLDRLAKARSTKS
jgi:glutamyl-tRNA synthetase